MDKMNLEFLDSNENIPIDKIWEGKCVACSPINDKGLKMKFNYNKSKEYCFSKYILNGDYCGFEGIAHGGIVATLLDEVAGWTIMCSKMTFGLTKSVEIKYFKPVPTETNLVVLGKIMNEYDENKIKIKSGIYLDDGLPLAEMESEWLLPSINQMTKISGKSFEELTSFKDDFQNNIKNILK